MAAKNHSTPLGRRLVRLMRIAGTTAEGVCLAPLSHRIFLDHAVGHPPTSYNVDLAPDNAGTFLVTCRELPELLTFGENEEEALIMAHLAIEEALSARRSPPDFPH